MTIGHPLEMTTQTWANTHLAIKAKDAAVTTAFAGVQVQLQSKQDTLTPTIPLTKSGSRISTLWKPSEVSVGTGLVALASDNLGILNLSLTGLESKSAVRIFDSRSFGPLK